MKRCAGRMHQSRMRKGSIISAPKRISSKLGTVRMRRKPPGDRKSTRLNSSHSQISYAVFCLKKKKKHTLVTATHETQLLAVNPTGRPAIYADALYPIVPRVMLPDRRVFIDGLLSGQHIDDN